MASKYKFRELKIYSTTEWLTDNKKKYRQVFERRTSSYIYAELSFHNKLFDVEDWKVEVELRCFRSEAKSIELCSLPFKRKIEKTDDIAYIREGWGNKQEGAFWKKGTYFWEAYIDKELVDTKFFYIEEPEDKSKLHPYLEVESLKLYEGPFDDLSEEKRMYYKKFHGEETRYVYLEILLRNISFSSSWMVELFTRFYTSAKELKGKVIRLQQVEEGTEFVKITAGWGSNVKGSWRNSVLC
ncbi:MAG: hypothetical protein AAF960_17855 [Bacteroidota bacterium]